MAENKTTQKTVEGVMLGKTISESVEEVNAKYKKPDTYTGNRKLFDDAKAKIDIKESVFENGKVKDPYTRKTLCLKKEEAEKQFGTNWSKHLAEADHKYPLKKVFEENKENPWNTNEDIRNVANDKDNLEVVSRKFNNAKRDRTNEELMNDKKYLRDKDLKINKQNRDEAIEKGKLAKEKIDQKLSDKAFDNCTKEFHKAGLKTGGATGGATLTVSGIINIIAVIKGEKTPTEALKNVAKDTALATVKGYVIGGGTTIVAHQLESMFMKSSSPFLSGLNKANLPIAVITAVKVTADIMVKYAKGEISTSECILQLGERGTNIMVANYTAVVGQMLIPIPFVGAAVGAMVGSVLTSAYYKELLSAAEAANLAKEEYAKIKRETDAAIKLLNQETEEFEKVTQKLFKERAEAINAGFKDITKATMDNDFELMAKGLERISNSFGRSIGYKTFAEFDEMMKNQDVAFKL